MMKRPTRILIAGIVVEALLAGIGIWLLTQIANGSLTPTTSVAETRATIFTVLGGNRGCPCRRQQPCADARPPVRAHAELYAAVRHGPDQ
jgi:hypothetical protein